MLGTQAASGLEKFKMEDSPAKKLKFEFIDKENVHPDTPVVDAIDLKKPKFDLVKSEEKPSMALDIKTMEAEEPLLRENPHRFVMFPIKYHEVRVLYSRHA